MRWNSHVNRSHANKGSRLCRGDSFWHFCFQCSDASEQSCLWQQWGREIYFDVSYHNDYVETRISMLESFPTFLVDVGICFLFSRADPNCNPLFYLNCQMVHRSIKQVLLEADSLAISHVIFPNDVVMLGPLFPNEDTPHRLTIEIMEFELLLVGLVPTPKFTKSRLGLRDILRQCVSILQRMTSDSGNYKYGNRLVYACDVLKQVLSGELNYQLARFRNDLEVHNVGIPICDPKKQIDRFFLSIDFCFPQVLCCLIEEYAQEAEDDFSIPAWCSREDVSFLNMNIFTKWDAFVRLFDGPYIGQFELYSNLEIVPKTRQWLSHLIHPHESIWDLFECEENFIRIDRTCSMCILELWPVWDPTDYPPCQEPYIRVLHYWFLAWISNAKIFPPSVPIIVRKSQDNWKQSKTRFGALMQSFPLLRRFHPTKIEYDQMLQFLATIEHKPEEPANKICKRRKLQ